MHKGSRRLSDHETKDKYGRTHPNQREAEFANRCYEMMDFLRGAAPNGIGLLQEDAEKIVSQLILNRPDGVVARSRFRTFIQLIEVHYGKLPGQV